MKQDLSWHDRCHVATEGIKFQCQKCGKCCCAEVALTYSDIECIKNNNSKLLGAIYQTISPRYENLPIYTTMHGRSPSDDSQYGHCVYRQNNICDIYDFRPLTCHIYPFSIELKKRMKEKRKLPRQAFTVIEPRSSNSFVIVYDPECPGIGKGNQVDLKRIASLEFTNMERLAQTYQTSLKDQIPELLFSKEDSETTLKYIQSLNSISEQKLVGTDSGGNPVYLQIHLAYHPSDNTEEESKKLINNTLLVWKDNFPANQGTFINYILSEAGEIPQKSILVYVGVQKIKDQISSVELFTTFYQLYRLENLRHKLRIAVALGRAKYENGQWISA